MSRKYTENHPTNRVLSSIPSYTWQIYREPSSKLSVIIQPVIYLADIQRTVLLMVCYHPTHHIPCKYIQKYHPINGVVQPVKLLSCKQTNTRQIYIILLMERYRPTRHIPGKYTENHPINEALSSNPSYALLIYNEPSYQWSVIVQPVTYLANIQRINILMVRYHPTRHILVKYTQNHPINGVLSSNPSNTYSEPLLQRQHLFQNMLAVNLSLYRVSA